MNQDNLGNTDVSAKAALPFSQACANNKAAILAVLKTELRDSKSVLEIGSGTGQHSVYFAPHLAHLEWHTSDVPVNHQAIQAWHAAYPAPNLHLPRPFDLRTDALPMGNHTAPSYDAVFTANTLHIISWALVARLFELVGTALPVTGRLIIYGPFNEAGRYTSEGNCQFDRMLRQRDPNSGIRNKEDIIALAQKHRLHLTDSYEMPANNQLLSFIKIAAQ